MHAATQAAARLAALGFEVKEMLGGYDAWRAAGHALETGEPPERSEPPEPNKAN
jgi:rhodanese-related sulfurtransferase